MKDKINKTISILSEYNNFLLDFVTSFKKEDFYYDKKFLNIFYWKLIKIIKFIFFMLGAYLVTYLLSFITTLFFIALGFVNTGDITFMPLYHSILYILPFYLFLFYLYIKSKKEFELKNNKNK